MAVIERMTFNLKRKFFDPTKDISRIGGQTIMEMIILAESRVRTKFNVKLHYPQCSIILESYLPPKVTA